MSGGKLNTVMQTFLSLTCFFLSSAHLMARSHTASILSWSAWDFPVLESLPEKMMGSRPPSSSGRATCRAT